MSRKVTIVGWPTMLSGGREGEVSPVNCVDLGLFVA